MRRGTVEALIGLCFMFEANNASSDVKITIEQTPSEPMNYESAVNTCNDTWNRMTEGDRELENIIISRFGSKRGYLRKCANDLVEKERQELRYPVKEVYCELEAYQKTIAGFYEEFEGNFIDWKKFRALTALYLATSNCMNEDIPDS